jgi:hypothetical protein
MVGIYERRGQYILSSMSKTVHGLWMGNEAFELLDGDVTDAELGAAVARMLAASRTGVPQPNLRENPNLASPYLAALGLKSFTAFAKRSRHVDVEQDGEKFLIIPLANGGSREGYVEIEGEKRRCEAPRPDELGSLVRACLAVATA